MNLDYSDLPLLEQLIDATGPAILLGRQPNGGVGILKNCDTLEAQRLYEAAITAGLLPLAAT